MNTPIYAAASGTISLSGWECQSDPCALRIVIRHDNEIVTGYWHLNELNVRAGQYVNRGEQIGLSGQTGMADWPHLHFLVMENGIRMNPKDFMKFALVKK
jgi:murein DD-endopeptidase MepM/ murein hydrolase activator NlpD